MKDHCYVKWCENKDLVITGIGYVCNNHIWKEPKLEQARIMSPQLFQETVGVNVAEVINSGDGLV